jgi:lipopolysaccharide/colanic/teichoic acid biosynthesis glycosyltransferase
MGPEMALDGLRPGGDGMPELTVEAKALGSVTSSLGSLGSHGGGVASLQAVDSSRIGEGLGNTDVGILRALNAVLKRLLDIALATLLCVVLAPVLLLAVVLIRLSDGGPAIFWQRRVGQGGREFWFPKLRSMDVGAEEMHGTLLSQIDDGNTITFKMRDDPRVTSIGRILRMWSIDELPQLWSVLNGDMSLVGPRPPLPSEVERYSPLAMRRLQVKPGITCIWQVSGRSMLPFDQQLALDLEYVGHQSLWLDLKLILRTIPAVLSCKGAW